MKQPLAQIAFDFFSQEEQTPPPVQPAASQPLPPAEDGGQIPLSPEKGQQEGYASGVVFRVKSLKKAPAPPPEQVVESQPVDKPADTLIQAASDIPASTDPEGVTVAEEPVPSAQAVAETAVEEVPEKPFKSRRGRKSLKQATAEADLIEIPVDEVLFRKQYYTMGEVADMFRVNQSLLRFWETEFDVLKPRKNKKGDRYFRPADIKSLHLIYHLLRQRKYTIEGAKEFLKNNKKSENRFDAIQRLQEVKAFLLEWKAQL
ncbi:MerR family transcriptional regulator [Flavitalea flava]